MRCFDQSDLAIVREVESLLIDAANGKDIPEIPEAFAKYFQGTLDLTCLKIQLKMLPDAITNAFASSAIRVEKVTHVRTIVDTFNQSQMYKNMLNQVDKLVRSYLTFPVTSAADERAFSSLRRIKTFLRSTMSQHRLNNLFLLYVHKARTNALDLSSVAKDFVYANSRRSNYFGKF